jgi:hypothetical protein
LDYLQDLLALVGGLISSFQQINGHIESGLLRFQKRDGLHENILSLQQDKNGLGEALANIKMLRDSVYRPGMQFQAQYAIWGRPQAFGPGKLFENALRIVWVV